MSYQFKDYGDGLRTEIDSLRNKLSSARRALETISEDCDGWLNNQCDETACEFIKAVRDHSTKALNL
jgi:hypothetical protein